MSKIENLDKIYEYVEEFAKTHPLGIPSHGQFQVDIDPGTKTVNVTSEFNSPSHRRMAEGLKKIVENNCFVIKKEDCND